MSIRPIAIYLPQFHPIPENDAWWGKGFTEWTNVAKAQPLFKGHYQPHLPADLGFYDLRLAEAREEQVRLAKEYGINGFCYYHYWFNGRRVLERPFQEVFDSGKPDFPFMLCWANENWTRTWDGQDKHVLLEQNYSEQDHIQHIRNLIPYFKDPRYIRVGNKPVFAVYKAQLIPDLERAVSLWRQEAEKEGLELYLCWFETLGAEGKDYTLQGFDAGIEFQPHGGIIHYYRQAEKVKTLRDEVSLSTIKNSIQYRLNKVLGKTYAPEGLILDYEAFMKLALTNEFTQRQKRYRCITPGWDNSARKAKDYFILTDSTPEKFKAWVNSVLGEFRPYSEEENFLFINAWNEWAEGNHLEPCQKWGKAYLERLKEALNNA